MSLIAKSSEPVKRDYEDAAEIINFGRYRGHTIGEIIENEPSWICWALDAEAITLSRALLDTLEWEGEIRATPLYETEDNLWGIEDGSD